MWLRCRNSLSGHEASIPVDLVESLTDWTPIEGAEPSATFADPVYDDASPQTSGEPGNTPPLVVSTGTPENKEI